MKTLDLSGPGLMKLFQFLKKNLVISKPHFTILTTGAIAKSIIDEHHDILWIQVMKSMLVTEYSSFETMFLSDCKDCEDDQDAVELTKTLEPQLRWLLLPEVT